MTYQALHFIQCLTPLHNGSGQGLGTIDRPIVREPATRYPFVQSSTLKGAYRALAEETGEDADLIRAAFGNRKGASDLNRGCLAFADARLLAFPVRSLAGTCVLATSRLALARLRQWVRRAVGSPHPLDQPLGAVLAASANLDSGSGRAQGASVWPTPGEPASSPDARWDSCIRLEGGGYCLEGLMLEAAPDPGWQAAKAQAELASRLSGCLYASDDSFWKTWFRQRFLLVNETDFQDFTLRCTQVDPSTAIGDDGTAEGKSLRYTEYLPSETVLAGLVQVDPPRGGGKTAEAEEVWRLYLRLAGRHVQFGGDESKGRGLASCRAEPVVAPSSESGEEAEKGGGHADVAP